jgi:hypothetical protein
MTVKAYYPFKPTNWVVSNFTITYERCFTTVISTINSPDVTYTVRAPPITTDLSGWDNTFGAECNQFQYTATVTNSTSAIKFSSSPSPVFTISTNLPLNDGYYNVTMKGELK